MAHTWNLRLTVLYFFVLTLGEATVLNKAASPQNKKKMFFATGDQKWQNQGNAEHFRHGGKINISS